VFGRQPLGQFDRAAIEPVERLVQQPDAWPLAEPPREPFGFGSRGPRSGRVSALSLRKVSPIRFLATSTSPTSAS